MTTRVRPLRDAALALSLLTVLPVRARWPEGEKPSVAGWFPLVGLLLGSGSWVLAALLALGLGERTPLLQAVVVVTAAALLTRFLHYDGLADVADAWWGGDTPVRRREIMKDSATGAFGATALGLCLIAQVASVEALILAGALWCLPVAHVSARFAATFAAWLGVPASPGLGAAVSGRPDVASGLAATIGLAAVTVVAWAGGGVAGLALAGLGIILALGVPHVIASRMGGVTGDVMGASVVIVEVLVLLTAGVIV